MIRRQAVRAAGLLLLVIVLAACAAGNTTTSTTVVEPRKNADGFVDITVEQLDQMLKNKDFVLVNVHIPYEGEIPNTDLFIPFNAITDNLDKLPNKSARIILYCRSGSMSTIAAKALVAQGYTNVYELDGGFNAWKASGRPFIVQQ